MKVSKKSVDACNKSIDESEKIIANTINALKREIEQTENRMNLVMQDMTFHLRHGDIPNLTSASANLRTLESRRIALKDALSTVGVLGNLKFKRVEPKEMDVTFGKESGFTAKVSS